MGERYTIRQMIQQADEAFLLAAYAHIRVLTEEAGFRMEGGVIIYIPDREKKDSVLSSLEACEGVVTQLGGKLIPWNENYKMVLVPYMRHYKELLLEEFLACKDYLPSIVVEGVLPDTIRNHNNIVLIEEINQDYDSLMQKKEVFQEFTIYTHHKVSQVIGQLKTCKSFYFEGRGEESQIQQVLRATLEVYTQYICDKFDVATDRLQIYPELEEVRRRIKRMCSIVEDLKDEWDISSIVRRCLVRYIEHNQQVRIAPVDTEEGELLQAIQKKTAILYSENFYYIPDEMMQSATKSLHHTIPYNTIKQRLCMEDALICGEEKQSFTVKVPVMSRSGEMIRQRFLKFLREVFDMEGRLSIADRRSNVSGNS